MQIDIFFKGGLMAKHIGVAFIILLGCAIFLGQTASAATYTIDYTDSGWYNASSGHNPSNDNYIVGNCCGTGEYRNFLVFDLTGVTGTIVSATLEAESPSTLTPDPSETWTLYDVTTPVATLVAGGVSAAIFSDLGSGTSYGNVTVANGYTGIVTVTLNANAIAALNAAKGSSIAIGGALSTLGAGSDEFIFADSFGGYVRRLTIQTVATPVPTMNEWGMIIFMVFAGLVSLYYLRRQRKTEN